MKSIRSRYCRVLKLMVMAALFPPLVTLAQTNGLRLNEVLANCVRTTNDQGKVIAWAELYNDSGSVLDLTGYGLSDSSVPPPKFVFPTGTIIPPAGSVVVNFGSPGPRGIYTGFVLSPFGGAVYLVNGSGQPLDSVSYGLQAVDYSVGRVPDGSGNWILNTPTPGARNLAAALGSPADLKINEWMAINGFTLPDPRDGMYDDWIELYNPTNRPIALGGLYLSDDLFNLQKFHIPTLSFIGTGAVSGYALFFADGTAQDAQHVNFKLNAAGEAIVLSHPDSTVIDSVTTCMPPRDIAEGRLPDGSTNIILFLPQTRVTASPGAPNPLPSIMSIVNLQPQSSLRLQFTVQSNLDCIVQYRDQCGGAWQDLTNVPLAATNREVEIIDAQPAGGQRYYRLKR